MRTRGGAGGRVRKAITAGLDAVALQIATRPRRAAAVLAVLTWAAMAATPAAADDKKDCGAPDWMSWACSDTFGKIVNGFGKLPIIGGGVTAADETQKVVDALTPSNILDSWAQGLCHAVVFMLSFIASTAEKLATPAFNQKWWAEQYAVTFGLSLIFLAFMLLMIIAKVGGGQGSSVSGIELLRKSGVRLVFVVPACALAPALLYSLQGLASELSKSFSTQATIQANGAIGSFMTMIQKHAGNGWADFGGTLMVIVLMIPIVIFGIILLIEMAVSSWGLMICGLLVPLVTVAAVYPPWARALRRLAGLIFGMMFMPSVVFFFFWTVWSSVNALFETDASNSPVTICIFVLVSVFMVDSFPVVAFWVMGMVAPGAETMPGDVRGAAPNPTPGDLYNGSVDKLFKGGGKGGGAGAVGSGGEGGDGEDGDGEDGSDGLNGSNDSNDDVSKAEGGDDDGGGNNDGGDDDGNDDGPDDGGPGGGGAADGDDGGGSGVDDLSPRPPGGSVAGSADGDGGGGSLGGGAGGAPAPAPAPAAAAV
ncbi:hypothetical protein ACIOJE_34955 [Kitasatospora sp. NPDC087861]|uniref:hypothetical protein n=1 Tax=Kitasatospora sp. NPDC087861 TaxID=3364070 RepID=UPI00381B5FDB